MPDIQHKIECECWYTWNSEIDRTGQEVCPECGNFDSFEEIGEFSVQDYIFDHEQFAITIQNLSDKYWKRDVSDFLGHLCGTVWKMYDDEEQLMVLQENCKEFNENPICFNY